MEDHDPIEMMIAESLASSLCLATFVAPYSKITPAAADFRPDWKTTELAKLKTAVVPGALNINVYENRGADLHSVICTICLGKVIDSPEDLKKLIRLRTHIQNQIRSKALPPSNPPMPSGVSWYDIDVLTTVNPDELNSSNVFLSNIEITYRVLLGRIDEG